MSEQIRRHDWASTPLGPLDSWPAALRTATQLVIASKFPMCLAWGPQLVTIYNDAFAPILGSKQHVLGRSFNSVWSEVWEQIGPIAEEALKGQATFIEDLPLLINRNGHVEETTFTFCYSPVRDEAGQVVGMLDTVVETTDKHRVERELRDLANSLERQVAERTADRNRLWQLSTDIMLVTRLDHHIVAANPAWHEVLGWWPSELGELDLRNLIHPDDLPAVLESSVSLERGDPRQDIDCRIRHKDGSYRWISWAAVPAEGFIYSVGRDFTVERERSEALRQAEELLRHSQKMEAVGQLTGGLAHDFNNLLSGISGSLELLRLRIAQGRFDELERYIGAAYGAASRAAMLTHRLLAFSRRQTLAPKPTNVNRLIEGMVELIRRTMGPMIQIDIDAEPALWTALVDPNQLESALLNLCINARDAMPDGGRFTIKTSNDWFDEHLASERGMEPGPYLTLCIIDTGSGMSLETIARAFDPFFTTKPAGQGTGLGLSMVYGFARQSGGQVHIASEPGEGTTVCIYLPRHLGEEEATRGSPDQGKAPNAENGETILVIDDEETLRLLMAEVLGELGYRVMEAADGVAGLAILQSAAKIDLLITDVGLPGGLNGRQVADAARQQRPGLRVLFVTGYAESVVFGNERQVEGMEVLTKPFTIEVLAERVRRLLKSTAD
ncbi:response regulator [Pseudomonas sp. UL073]|uniref:histidine kinase n=1 Tax=Zestomonas insulae TaxID=2809017 RepID=A0ABS2IFG2_9GAMM|nr:PAS domain-containing sensor histidine kinase [Pseudomonas insulae]MBM7061831.1 response regulator [Pseudomonas insulae]